MDKIFQIKIITGYSVVNIPPISGIITPSHSIVELVF